MIAEQRKMIAEVDGEVSIGKDQGGKISTIPDSYQFGMKQVKKRLDWI